MSPYRRLGLSLPADTRIGSVTLAVSSLERSLRFYEDTLGFRRLEHERSLAVLSADGRTPLIELHEHPRAVRRPRRSAGLFHVAILVPSRAALGRSLRRLAADSWPITGAADHLVSEALYLDDPDGLSLEIYCDRPRSSWRIDEGQIVMATDPLDLDGLAREEGAAASWQGLDATTVIGHVHLQVGSLPAAEAFYCGEVGFTPTLRRYPGALFVAAGGYHHHLGLNTWAGAGVPPPPADAVGLRRFTVRGAGLDAREVADPATGVVVGIGPLGGGA